MPSFSHLIPRASDATPPQGGGRRSDSATATGSGQRRRSRVSPMWDGDRSLGIIKESPETASVRRLNRSRSNESLPSPGRRYRHAIQVLEIRNEQLEKRLAAEQFKHSLVRTPFGVGDGGGGGGVGGWGGGVCGMLCVCVCECELVNVVLCVC